MAGLYNAVMKKLGLEECTPEFFQSIIEPYGKSVIDRLTVDEEYGSYDPSKKIIDEIRTYADKISERQKSSALWANFSLAALAVTGLAAVATTVAIVLNAPMAATCAINVGIGAGIVFLFGKAVAQTKRNINRQEMSELNKDVRLLRYHTKLLLKAGKKKLLANMESKDFRVVGHSRDDKGWQILNRPIPSPT